MRAAKASASSTAAVANNIPLCEVGVTGDIERVLGQQIRKFFYYHDNSLKPSYSCTAYTFSEPQVEVAHFEVEYKSSAEIDVAALYGIHNYSEAAAQQDATRFTIEGVDGEGVTFPLDTNNWTAVWQYPDGTLLITLVVRNSFYVEKISNGGEIASSITKIFAPKVPQIAAGPSQDLTYYP
ncbi:hypothetical protein [Actinomyces sp. ZJ308]|uniref:hypothetical protein n=1 Tax=Actinomyces sp. ZJ308 TaxID=2708342 RepID=UPI001FBB0F63|nr:hypothetical protein [Actinomyces sp. ZJ308]